MILVRLTGSWTASAAGLTVDLESRRRGSPICALARKLIEAGHDAAEELRIFRGETLCFRPAPLGMWAGLRVKEGGRDSARFAPHREPPFESADSGGREKRIVGHPASPSGPVPEKPIAAPESAPGVVWKGPADHSPHVAADKRSRAFDRKSRMDVR